MKMTVRVLAVDDEFLITLDIQQMLSGTGLFDVQTGSTADLDQYLMGVQPFDVVIIDPMSFMSRLGDVLEMISETGAVPLLSASDRNTGKDQEEGTVVRVLKPFADRELLTAISQALLPVQPEKARAVMALI